MDKNDYLAEGWRQLNSTRHYQIFFFISSNLCAITDTQLQFFITTN